MHDAVPSSGQRARHRLHRPPPPIALTKTQASNRRRAASARRRRQRLLIALGARCTACGAAPPDAVLHFHHCNPGGRQTPSAETLDRLRRIREYELDHTFGQLQLLCTSCHTRTHLGLLAPKDPEDGIAPTACPGDPLAGHHSGT
jgi:hypothetical protein